MNFGLWIDEKLKKHRLKKNWLAKAAGVSHASLNLYKLGTVPSLKVAYVIVAIIALETKQEPEELWNEIFLMLEEK